MTKVEREGREGEVSTSLELPVIDIVK